VARLGIRGTVVDDRQPLTQTAGHLVFYLWLAWGQKPRWPAYIAEPPARRCVHETWINQPQDLGYYFGSASCRTAKTIQAKRAGKRACGLQEHELKQERYALTLELIANSLARYKVGERHPAPASLASLASLPTRSLHRKPLEPGLMQLPR
jgi:hypothetical protein